MTESAHPDAVQRLMAMAQIPANWQVRSSIEPYGTEAEDTPDGEMRWRLELAVQAPAWKQTVWVSVLVSQKVSPQALQDAWVQVAALMDLELFFRGHLPAPADPLPYDSLVQG